MFHYVEGSLYTGPASCRRYAAYQFYLTKGRHYNGMERYVPFVREVLRLKERGGRVRRVSWGEIAVLDVASLSEPQIHQLQAAGVHVSVLACTESLSGFTVRLRIDSAPTGPLIASAAVLAILCAVIAYCMQFI